MSSWSTWLKPREYVEPERSIPIGSTEPANKLYKGNSQSTTKYNLITFVPKALFEQYRRVANWYFTIVAALSLTAYTPVRAWTTWLPLGIVLGVSMIKEAIEDFKRYQTDVEVNNRPVEVLDAKSGTFVTKKWKEVVAGEIVEVRKDEQFPADLLFLTAESVEGNCYIETMNLDGETNLKNKQAVDASSKLKKETIGQFKGAEIKCEPPNKRLYQFTGNLILKDRNDPLSISPAAILLRGCILRNTHRIYGVVVYAGHDTKIFMNSAPAPSKRSQIEKFVDYIIFFMFFLLFSFCFIGACYDASWIKDNFNNHWYLGPQYTNEQYNPKTPAVNGITNFITAFILYGYLIPISLYVSMEIVKISQSMVFISRDLEMYHEETDTPAMARTSNLNEDLGQVNTVLSDKTGTLTRNVMEFFKCSIAGVSYGAGVTEIEKSNALRRGEAINEVENPGIKKFHERFFNFYDERLMEQAWVKREDREVIEMFFRLLAVCHTVIPEGDPTPKEIKYAAESPDEAALVVFAKVMGFFFFKRTNAQKSMITVKEATASGTQDVEYELLQVIEFTSTRKRQSVIVKDSKGKYLLFCKGADTVIYERLAHSNALNQRLKDPTTKHMEEYGSAGLRTLCLAYAEIPNAEYEEWNKRLSAAKTSMQDRAAKEAEVNESIEKDLILLGCTAIEDKLQEGVPKCIATLAEAGIRLWVLTGDKMETAINIGFACSLITEDMRQFIITAEFKDVEEMEYAAAAQKDKAVRDRMLKEAHQISLERVKTTLLEVESEMDKAMGGAKGSKEEVKFAMVINGKALSYALEEDLSQQFLKVGLRCQAVICCRVSPAQKGDVTALVKSHGDITLAIGDGANDVPMIQKAHIGVGISGQEGMQAVQASDFAIAQFRFLTPLLLVHGRWSYKRITRMICFFFFKNLMFGTTIFIFNALTTFSGQYMYSDVFMTLFNVFFTALTPLVIGIFDRDVDRHVASKYPALYKQGQKNVYFNFWAITGWLCTSMFQCAVILVLILIGCNPTIINRQSGHVWGTYETGITMFSVIIINVHLQIATITEQWTVFHHVAIWLSTFVWWMFLLAFDVLPLNISLDLYHLFLGVAAWNPQYWLYLPLVPMACLSPDFFFRAVRRQLFPPDHLLVIERSYLDQQAEARGQSTVSKVRPSALATRPSALPPKAGLIGSKGGASPRGEAEAAQKQSMVKAAFDNQLRTSNKGYVPPYDPQSQFYNILSNGQMAGEAAQGTPARNPLLQVLDAQFAATQVEAAGATRVDNPYRGAGNSYTATGTGQGLQGNSFRSTIDTTDPAQVIGANPHLTEPEARILSAYAGALEK